MRILISLFWVCIFITCRSQQVSHLHFGLEEGLLSTETYDLFQDRRGFIWIATDNGVAQYDGNKVRNFQATDGLTDPVVFGINEDAKGRIWFRTFSGKVSYHENGVVKAYRYNNLIEPFCKASLLQSFYIDNGDNVWFGTGEMFGKISGSGLLEMQKLTTRRIECAIVGNEVVFGYPWPHQFIDAINIEHKIYTIDLTDKINHTLNVPILKLGDAIIFGLGKDIFQYKAGKISHIFSGKNTIISLSNDREGNLWAGFLRAGVIKFSAKNLSQEHSIKFLEDKSVTRVLNDHQGGLWFSTLENGVYRIPDFDILYFETPTFSRIKGVASDGYKSYAGMEDGSVFSFDRKFNIQSIKKPGDPILSMLVDSKRRLWASSTMDTEVFDSLGHKLLYYPISHNDLFENKIAVWGLARTRLVKYVDGEDYKNVVIPYLCRSVSGYDTMMVLTERIGLDVYGAQLKKKVFGPILQNHKLSKVMDLNDSLILLSSIGSGFFVIDKNTWGKDFFFNVKLMGDNIYSVVKVDTAIWMGTENGIAITTMRSLIHKRPTFVRITNQNGLVKNKISALKEMGNNVLAFSENTFCVIPKSKRIQNKPNFYLESVRVNNQPISQDTLTRLRYFQNNFQVRYGFISFNNQNIMVRSRVNHEAPWGYSLNKELLYNSLSPGDYSFEMEYSLDNYRWQPIPNKIIFSIAEPWWLNKYLQLSVFCVVLALVYLFLRNQISMLKQRQKLMEANSHFQEELLRAEHLAMEKERSRIAKDLHDGVGTSLSVIKISVYTELREHETRRIFLTEQIDGAIDEIREIVHDLAPHGIDRDGIRAGLDEYLKRMKKKAGLVDFDFHFYGEEKIDLKIAISVFRIVQELVTNSLKHAKATQINLHISSEKENFNMVYRDNGTGLGSTKIQNHNGHGLRNIQSRVNSMNGKIQIDSNEWGVFYEIRIPLFTDTLAK